MKILHPLSLGKILSSHYLRAGCVLRGCEAQALGASAPNLEDTNAAFLAAEKQTVRQDRNSA